MSYQQGAIKEVVEKLKSEGFLVWVAESGLYGFYSDASKKRVVYFEARYGVVEYAGCYRPKNHADGRHVGTGWTLPFNGILSGDQYATILDLAAPCWATNRLDILYHDVDSYLKTNKHSKYTLVPI